MSDGGDEMRRAAAAYSRRIAVAPDISRGLESALSHTRSPEVASPAQPPIGCRKTRKEIHMRGPSRSLMMIAAGCVVALALTPSAQQGPQERGGQEEFGPYEFVENWPQ